MLTPRFSVCEVRPVDGHTLLLTFADGRCGAFDMTPLLGWDVYARLRDPDLFARAHAEHGTVVWPGNIDVAPELLYEGLVESHEGA